ncbi:hypothetical protein HZY97_18595 [Sphingomonas sp. R-74633]|uniref:hypothetical protein n=1 Tax=Sphingomonas sp. R-74633 TaxID=2751188 RepID=UPI0015D31648|nr:hypothetical protein [Sphingomonas sp. R-74633]NYT42789.1 hypothetical protein [Sphingomonas sp. R-74633]
MISRILAALALVAATPALTGATPPQQQAQRDGAHDFDFLIGNWKAHVRRLPDRLVGSTKWIEYDGISNHQKLLDTNANFEEFDVRTADGTGRIKAQTLRLYDPKTRQWAIYGIDLDAGQLPMPATVGQFNGKRGEFYDMEPWKGRMILVRFVWEDLGPKAARMTQSFSADGGKSWEANWICELTR